MNLHLGDIANLVGGDLHGDATVSITGAAILRDAHEGDITLADREHVQQLAACRASAVLVPPDLAPSGKPFVTVTDVHASFAKIVEQFRPLSNHRTLGVSAAAQVARSASIGPRVVIHAGATIGENVVIGADSVIHPGVRVMDGCQIGANVVLFPNVILYENTVLGDRVILHAGVVVGAYGFGYHLQRGRHERGAQLGNVEIGNDVEVGANSTIDRGTYGPTTIGDGTKIDNLVMIAHNCRIGRHNLICSQVGVAGSCSTGDYVVMAGQVGLRDHIHIGDQVILGAKAGVMHSINEPGAWLGIPATREREQMVKLATLAKLPEMRKEFKSLQKKVAELASLLASSSPAAE